MDAKISFTWPPVPSRRYAPYCAWFWANRILRSGLQTDLLCVHESFLPDFLETVAPEGDLVSRPEVPHG
jgi:hypothetical protein